MGHTLAGVAEILALLIVVGGFAAVLGGFVWLAARIRRRGLGGAVMGPIDEVYNPGAHRARYDIQVQHERAQPSPAAGDGP